MIDTAANKPPKERLENILSILDYKRFPVRYQKTSSKKDSTIPGHLGGHRTHTTGVRNSGERQDKAGKRIKRQHNRAKRNQGAYGNRNLKPFWQLLHFHLQLIIRLSHFRKSLLPHTSLREVRIFEPIPRSIHVVPTTGTLLFFPNHPIDQRARI